MRDALRRRRPRALPAAAPAIGRGFLRALLHARLGGPARTRVIVLFACVLGLETADLASLGAIANELKPALHLRNAGLGMLAAAPALVAVVATLPFGVLADRVARTPLLAVATGTWAVAMVLSGAAGSFQMLLVVRVLLGAATAAAAPLIASLVGDLFWPSERAAIYGYMLAGQLLGTAFGLLVIGNVAAVSWRLALWVLALPSIALAWALWRALPEPARGGASRLRRGRRKLKGAPQPATTKSGRPTHSRDADAQSSRSAAKTRDSTVARAVAQTRAKPHRKLVLDCDPRRMSVWEAARYVLRVRTNVLLIVSSVSTRAT